MFAFEQTFKKTSSFDSCPHLVAMLVSYLRGPFWYPLPPDSSGGCCLPVWFTVSTSTLSVDYCMTLHPSINRLLVYRRSSSASAIRLRHQGLTQCIACFPTIHCVLEGAQRRSGRSKPHPVQLGVQMSILVLRRSTILSLYSKIERIVIAQNRTTSLNTYTRDSNHHMNPIDQVSFNSLAKIFIGLFSGRAECPLARKRSKPQSANAAGRCRHSLNVLRGK